MVVEPEIGLSQLLGVGTYRIRTELERFFPEEGVEGSSLSTVVSAVVEAENPEGVAVQVRQVWNDPEGTVEIFEYIVVDGRTSVRLDEGEWEDATDSDLFGHGPDPTPIMYHSLHGYTSYLQDSPLIGETAEWLGNEETGEGIPVGRYAWSRPDVDSVGPDAVVSEGEIWVDALGVVWRVRLSGYKNDMLLFNQDSHLLDVGTDVSIEPPGTG